MSKLILNFLGNMGLSHNWIRMRWIWKISSHCWVIRLVQVQTEELSILKLKEYSKNNKDRWHQNSWRNSRRRWSTWNWLPGGFLIRPLPPILVSQHSILMVMPIPNQLSEVQCMEHIWKLSTSIHILEETSQNLVRSMVEHYLVVLFKSGLQVQKVQRKDQSRWLENQFHQELLQIQKLYQMMSTSRNSLLEEQIMLKHSNKPKHVSWWSYHQPSQKSI